ncbi:MAG: TonB-dependent receptor [Gammaproteobacteria bacterium]|nr:TonB-dependent receptor [Gammaproteobacteria bacterium]
MLQGFAPVVSAQEATEQTFEFDIPAQAAHTALTEFAEQADLTLVFPDDVVRRKSANALIGRHTLQEGVDILLAGTGLTPVFSNEMVLSISADEQPTTKGNTMEIKKTPPLLKRLGTAIAASLFTTSAASGAAAEQQEEAERWIEEITVTAERREENILKVPVTMTAFSDKLIKELGMTNEEDLEQLVPGLQIGTASAWGQAVGMRGITTFGVRETHADLGVAVYVNDIYTVEYEGIAPNLFDVERVEVARGPQGTLHGRNSIGGSISYAHRRPTETWDATAQVELTDQFSQRYNVAVGGPLNEHWMFRISGGYFDGDGAQENVGTGPDWDAPDQTNIAPQLRFKGDRLELNLRYDRSRDTGRPKAPVFFSDFPRDDRNNFPSYYLYEKDVPSVEDCQTPPRNGGLWWQEPPLLSDLVDPGCLQNKIISNREGTRDVEVERLTLNVDYELSDGLTLSYAFGESESDTLSSWDADGTDRVGGWEGDLFFETEYGELVTDRSLLSRDAGVPFADGETVNGFMSDESSHELTLDIDFGGAWRGIVGYYHYENDVESTWTGTSTAPFESGVSRFTTADAAAQAQGWANCAEFLAAEVAPFLPTELGPEGFYVFCPEGADHTTTSRGIWPASSTTDAFFASVDYTISPQWLVSGGLRYTEDEKFQPFAMAEGVFDWDGIPVGFFESPTGTEFKGTWDKTIGHIAVEYTPPDTAMLVYGRISTGFRAGGFEAEPAEGLPRAFDDESLVNYEFGVKGLFLDQRMVLTTAIFYQDYKEMQFRAQSRIPQELLRPTRQSPYAEYTALVPDSSIWGIEAEASFQVSERLRLSGFYNLLDSEIGSFSYILWEQDAPFEEYTYLDPNADDDFDPATGLGCLDQMCTQLIPGPTDVTGNRLPQQPKHKAALTAAYSIPMADLGELQLLSTYSWTGERFTNIGNAEKTPSYGRLDLRAQWRSPNDRWAATLFVQNALEEIGVREYSFGFGSLTEERRIGLEVRWDLQP